MKAISFHEVTASEFNCIDTPLAHSIFEHYAHTALSTINLAHIYNYMMASGVNPTHSVEQHLVLLKEAERVYNF